MTEGVNRQAWRAKTVEQAIEPELPIIDAHHHLWPEVPAPHMEVYPFETLAAENLSSGHNIRQTVFVEASARYRTDGPEHLRCVGETEFANAMGESTAAGAVAGIVAAADMMLGDNVKEVLQAHQAAAPKRLRGIRYLVACDPDYMALGTRPGMLLEPAFRAAFAQLAPDKLTFDVWVMHPQLADVASLAEAFPDTTIILDHLGSPMQVGRFAGDAEAAFQDWRQGLALVASRPNVMVKIGGLHMEQTGLGSPEHETAPWSSDKIAEVQRRHVLTAIDLFGTDRSMFESNFPVDRLHVGATVLWNSFKKLSADFSADDRQQLFSGTAARVYRLPAA